MRVLTRQHPQTLLLGALVASALIVFLGQWVRNTRSPIGDSGTSITVAPVELSDPSSISSLQAQLKRNPDDTEAYAQLGHALLQRVRITADPLLYAQAEQAFDQALKRDARQFDALVGKGALALARHHFADALRWGEQARDANPYSAQPYGIIGDAQIELGRYDQAVTSIQKMVDTRPDVSSYSRVSYVRELHGDVPGAIQAMQQATRAGNPQAEATRWAQVYLGHLYFNSGDLDNAEKTYRQAMQVEPGYAYARAGLARVAAARGDSEAAIAIYREIVQALPTPEFVIALGELYEATGQTAEAQRQYDLVRAMQQLNADAGMNVDLELALFDADHGTDMPAALSRARKAYEARPSVYAADVLAWTLYRNGQAAEAQQYSQAALRLGTRDALLHYHTGMIAHANGDHEAAQRHLREALTINPAFSPLGASQAKATLAQLEP